MRTIIISIVFLFVGLSFSPSTSIAQIKGTISVGWSLGFTTKGGAFIKYYPLDGIAVEVFGGGYPHILHGGAELSIHPFMVFHDGYRNLAFTAGYSWFSGGINPTHKGQGINIGAEFMFTTKQSQLFEEDGVRENFFISIGSTYVTKSKSSEYDDDYEVLNTTVDEFNNAWMIFIESGLILFHKR